MSCSLTISGLSSPQSVAQRALEEAQTAALIGDHSYMLATLLSALHYIETKGQRGASRWGGLRAEVGWREDIHDSRTHARGKA